MQADLRRIIFRRFAHPVNTDFGKDPFELKRHKRVISTVYVSFVTFRSSGILGTVNYGSLLPKLWDPSSGVKQARKNTA
jgi:hypothetical protein